MSESAESQAVVNNLDSASQMGIKTRDLTRRFGKVTAVDSLELRVPAGSIFGLIGPNGAGKSTTLRMLAGVLEPTSGEIRINGLAIRQYWNEIQWEIGYMPDFFGVYDDLLVWEYLDFYGRCYHLSSGRRKQVTDELLELVDLTEKRYAYVNTLSLGMRQRLCLAHALVHDPQILLLDEPASGLDPRARVELRELLRELRAMGKTIVISSHILPELAELCDTVGIMEKGRMITSGSLDRIQKQIQDSRLLQITVISSLDAAEAFIQRQPGAAEISRVEVEGRENVLEVAFTGDDTAIADLLESLVRQGIRITAFRETYSDLEQAFLSLTKGEVA